MKNGILRFLKKTYKVLVIVVAAVIFFLGYNVYLVDRSLENLKTSLDKISKLDNLEDAKGLASALDYSLLNEISSPDLEAANFSRIEMAKDMLSKTQDQGQVEDVKFALSEAIKEKEEARSPVLRAIDKINQVFARKTNEISESQLRGRIGALENKVLRVSDREQAQQLFYEIGNLYVQISDFDKAKEAFKKSIQRSPDSQLAAKAQFNLAWAEKRGGNLDSAIEEFKKLSDSSSAGQLADSSLYQIADTYRKKGEFDKAIDYYKEAAKESTNQDLAQLAQLNVGYTYLYDVKDYDKARDYLEDTKSVIGDDGVARHIEKKVIPGISSQYVRDGFRLLNEGRALSDKQRFVLAINKFDQAIAADAQGGAPYSGKALAYLWLDDPDRALDAARKAVKFSPNDELARVNLGYIYIELEIVGEAIIEFKKLISINPFSHLAYYNLGYAYILENRLDEAIEAFMQSVNIDPHFSMGYNNIGWCNWQLGRYAAATEAFEKAIKIDPDFLDARFNLAMVYRNLGRFEEARDMLDKILKKDPQYPEAEVYLDDTERFLKKKQ
ncbi:MAG: tetratricopeptide repeat protein [Candidatus Omnitrophota bacterium]|jgi:tetratricopeptide (TPR) repeat protein|nr:MAG: tetratricopeptide repeat protein [Candidatus Omnitrophota bacterium]